PPAPPALLSSSSLSPPSSLPLSLSSSPFLSLSSPLHAISLSPPLFLSLSSPLNALSLSSSHSLLSLSLLRSSPLSPLSSSPLSPLLSLPLSPLLSSPLSLLLSLPRWLQADG